MATEFTAPTGFEPPGLGIYSSKDWRQREDEYLKRLAAEARKNGTDPLLGEVIRFGRGDGYAQYMVWRIKPLQLIWVELGDAWSVEEALIRGLRLADVREMVEGERRLRALFSRP